VWGGETWLLSGADMEEAWLAFCLPGLPASLGAHPHPGSAGDQDRAHFSMVAFQTHGCWSKGCLVSRAVFTARLTWVLTEAWLLVCWATLEVSFPCCAFTSSSVKWGITSPSAACS
jgi:hypothetical protein